jgi:hypothetical protein
MQTAKKILNYLMSSSSSEDYIKYDSKDSEYREHKKSKRKRVSSEESETTPISTLKKQRDTKGSKEVEVQTNKEEERKARDKAKDSKPKVSPSKSSNDERRRGQAFTESEIKTMLLGLFEGKDNAQIAHVFLEKHKGTGRTKQALKCMNVRFLVRCKADT